MKRILLIIPAIMMLTACGNYTAQQAPASGVVTELDNGGFLDDADHDTVADLGQDEQGQELLDDVNVSQDLSNSDDTVILDIKGQKATVEYMNDADYAFKINGLAVPHEVALNSELLDGLLEGLVDVGLDELIDGLIAGIPADIQALIKAGLEIINNGNVSASLGEIVGVVVRGFFNVFMNSIPFGNILAPVIGTIVDELVGEDILTGEEPVADGPEGTIADTITGWLDELF